MRVENAGTAGSRTDRRRVRNIVDGGDKEKQADETCCKLEFQGALAQRTSTTFATANLKSGIRVSGCQISGLACSGFNLQPATRTFAPPAREPVPNRNCQDANAPAAIFTLKSKAAMQDEHPDGADVRPSIFNCQVNFCGLRVPRRRGRNCFRPFGTAGSWSHLFCKDFFLRSRAVYFSKSSNSPLSVQASSMMSQSGLNWKFSWVVQGFASALGSSMLMSMVMLSRSIR